MPLLIGFPLEEWISAIYAYGKIRIHRGVSRCNRSISLHTRHCLYWNVTPKVFTCSRFIRHLCLHGWWRSIGTVVLFIGDDGRERRGRDPEPDGQVHRLRQAITQQPRVVDRVESSSTLLNAALGVAFILGHAKQVMATVVKETPAPLRSGCPTRRSRGHPSVLAGTCAGQTASVAG